MELWQYPAELVVNKHRPRYRGLNIGKCPHPPLMSFGGKN
jgi:hypothetical protein